MAELFPTQTTSWQWAAIAPTPDFPCVTELEVVEAAKRIKSNKAPGLDGNRGAVVKAVALARPDIFMDTFLQCLTDGVFPTRWTSQKLGPVHGANNYRPLCLQDNVGKLQERIPYSGIEAFNESINGLGSQQYGFRKCKITLEAVMAVRNIAKNVLDDDRWLGGSKEYCAVVTLDVKNALNQPDGP